MTKCVFPDPIISDAEIAWLRDQGWISRLSDNPTPVRPHVVEELRRRVAVRSRRRARKPR